MAEESNKLTLSQMEDACHAAALKWAKENTNLPETAFRLFLWPLIPEAVRIQGGPTARIIIGKQAFPTPENFNIFWDTVKRSILHVWHNKMYSTLAVESVAHIMEREAGMRRWWKEKYNFDPELIPHMLRDDEITIRRIERVEVVHKATGLIESVEIETSKGRSTFATQDIAKARLARKVLEAKLAAKPEAEVLPFPRIA